MNDTNPGRGGARKGAGRPAVTIKRIPRGMAFSDPEWAFIKEQAAKRGQSIREYLFTLAERDKGAGG